MLNMKLLTNKEEFESLKKGDTIMVVWSDYNLKHCKSMKKRHTYNIVENRNEGHEQEIICQIRDNHYFNYIMYLKKCSNAEEVYLISEVSEQ